MKKINFLCLLLLLVLSFSSCANCNRSDGNTDEEVCYLPVLYSYVKRGSDALSIFMTDFTNYRHGNFSEYSQHELKCMEGSKFHHIEYMYIPKIKNQTHEFSKLSISDVTDNNGQDFYFYYSFKREEPQIDPIRGTKEYDAIDVQVCQDEKIFEYVLEEYESAKKDRKDFKKTVISDTVCCYEYGEYIEWVIKLENPYTAYAYVQIEAKSLELFCPNGITDYDNLISFDLYKVVDGELVKAE